MNMLCSRCKKRIAVVFMTRMENGEPINEGLCMQCAKELGIQPVDDLMKKMGISEDELDMMNNQLMEIMGEDGEDGFEIGGAQPFPFLQNLFSGQQPPKNSGKDGGGSQSLVPGQERPKEQAPRQEKQDKKEDRRKDDKKRKYLNTYCENLTNKAKDGLIDNVVGRGNRFTVSCRSLTAARRTTPALSASQASARQPLRKALL